MLNGFLIGRPLRRLLPRQLQVLYRLPRVPTELIVMSYVALAACSPKIQVQAPSEPITINLNVKIEHEIKVQVDQDLENLFDDNDDIF